MTNDDDFVLPFHIYLYLFTHIIRTLGVMVSIIQDTTELNMAMMKKQSVANSTILILDVLVHALLLLLTVTPKLPSVRDHLSKQVSINLVGLPCIMLLSLGLLWP